MAKKKAKKVTKKKVAKKAVPKSKSITVEIARLSQDKQTINLPNGGVLQDALLAAGFFENDLENLIHDVTLNGKGVELKTHLKQGDFITISPRVQGGK